MTPAWALTYCSPESPVLKRSCNRPRPGGGQSARADLLFFFDDVRLARSGRHRVWRNESAPPSRRYGGGSNGCSTQATAYLRDTPPTRRESCAAVVVQSGVARIAPPPQWIRRRISATEIRNVPTG